MNSYESAVGQMLARRIEELLAEKHLHLEEAQFVNFSDPNATASTYISEVAYMRALRDCLQICQDIESDLRRVG